MAKRQLELANKAGDLLAKLELTVQSRVAMRHLDILIAIESFYCELLNRVFPWELENDNTICGKQQDSFDLSSKDSRIVVQVTYTTTADKIRDTLRKFIGTHSNTFDRLLFVYPQLKVPKSRADFSNQLQGFDFDPSRDRIGFGDVLRKLKGLSLEELDEVVWFLENSLEVTLPSLKQQANRHSELNKPIVFSKIPKSFRPSICEKIVGREQELSILKSMAGDRLIVGQPGIGKTSMLCWFANNDEGAFLRDCSESELVSEMRLHSPRFVLVNDAHLRIGLVENVQTIRREYGFTFDIIADCWPGEADLVAMNLNVKKENVVTLQPLANSLVIEMAREFGIYGPDYFYHHLVRQSLGYPGRASMLLESCKDGSLDDIQEFFNGESIGRWAKNCISRLNREESASVISCLSLGGDVGVDLTMVADYLALPARRIEETVSSLAVGGLVEQTQSGRFSVYPRAIRAIFVRDFFFGIVSRSFETFLAHQSIATEVVNAIADAFYVGANVPREVLYRLVEDVDAIECWRHLVYVDRALAERVFERKPELFDTLADAFIEVLPEQTVERFVKIFNQPERQANPPPEYPVRRVSDWACEGYPGKDALPRRRVVLNAIAQQLQSVVPADKAYRFLQCAVSPSYECNSQDPADFDRWLLKRGMVTLEDMQAMMDFWPEILQLVERYPPSDWQPIVDAVWVWLLPASTSGMTEDHQSILKESANQILNKLCSLATLEVGAVSAIHQVAEYLDIELHIPVDDSFDILFPREPRVTGDDYNAQMQRQHQAAIELGERWAQLMPHNVIETLTRYLQQSRLLPNAYPDFSAVVCATVGELSAPLDSWLVSAWEQNLRSDLFGQFLHQIARLKAQGYESWLERSLEDDRYTRPAIYTTLALADMPNLLVEKAILACTGHIEMLFVAILRREIQTIHYEALLKHSDGRVRGKVAEGMWGVEKTLPEPFVLPLWLQAAIADSESDHFIQEVMSSNSLAKMAWLTYWIEASERLGGRKFEDATILKATEDLAQNERIELLNRLKPNSFIARSLVSILVGTDAIVFRHLLGIPALGALKFRPLRRMPDECWAMFAMESFTRGISEVDVERASGPGWDIDFGDGSKRRERILTAWRCLTSHKNSSIRRIATHKIEQLSSSEY